MAPSWFFLDFKVEKFSTENEKRFLVRLQPDVPTKVNSLNEIGVACNRQREPQELPVGLLHGFKSVVRNLHARWCVGTAWDSRHINDAATNVFGVLKDWLVFGVPVSYWAFHVPVGDQEKMFKRTLNFKSSVTYTQKGS